MVSTSEPRAGTNCCVSLYGGSEALARRLRDLHARGIDITRISVIGPGYREAVHPVGFYDAGDGARYRGRQGEFWNGIWHELSGAAFLWIPASGPLVAGGPVATLLAGEFEAVEVGGGFGVLGSALYQLGVPRISISEYETALRNDKYLLIVQGSRQEVEQASEALHDETQQVTVHLAD